MDLFLKEVIEGSTKLLIPDALKYDIPEHAPVFYNPRFAADRDLGVLVLSTYFEEPAQVADILAGIGSRGLRYAKEAGMNVTLNDVQPSAVEVIKKNAELNNLTVTISNSEANRFLIDKRDFKFDAVDIDPFGSPVPFMSNVFKALNPLNSLLMITATDIGSLSGAYPKACYRKYTIKSGRTCFAHELGTRNLFAAIFNEGAKHSLAVRPLLCYADMHYYRMYVKVCGGRKQINRDSKEYIGYISYCHKCGYRKTFRLWDPPETKCICGEELILLGPTWIGKIGDSSFIAKLNEKRLGDFTISQGTVKLLNLLEKEVEFKEPYFDLGWLAKKKRKTSKKSSDVERMLAEKGYRTARTHFNPKAIKTNAGFEEVIELL